MRLMNAPDMNRLVLSGMVEAAPSFSHTTRGEDFLHLPLLVRRRSGTPDHLPVTLPARLVEGEWPAGVWMRVEGQLRAYDRFDETGRHLLLTAFARRAAIWEPALSPEAPGADRMPPRQTAAPHPMENEVVLTGTVCRPPVYRVTPLLREIADVLLCCERAYGRRDYIPAILWGTLAREAARWTPGRRVQLNGRFQSRAYDKLLPDGTVERRTAYEVSAAEARPLA